MDDLQQRRSSQENGGTTAAQENDFLREMMEYEAERKAEGGGGDQQEEDDDFIKQMEEYAAMQQQREQEARQQEEEYQQKLEALKKQHEEMLKGASEFAMSELENQRESDIWDGEMLKMDDNESQRSKQTQVTVKRVAAGPNSFHLDGQKINVDHVSNKQINDGPARKMLEDRSSQGYSQHFPSSMSGNSAAREDLKTRQATNRNQKIKRDEQEIEERVELNGESQISESKSKQSLLSFLKNDYGGSNSQQSASQSDLKLFDGATNEITEEDFDMNNYEGSQSQISFMLDKIDINNPNQKQSKEMAEGSFDAESQKQKKVNFDPRMKSSINFGQYNNKDLLKNAEEQSQIEENQMQSEGDNMMIKTSNNFTRTDENSKSNDDFDSSLNRNPLSQAMITKMTGFNKSAYNKSQFGDDKTNQGEDKTVADLMAEGVQLPKYFQEMVFEPEVVHDELIKENAINSLETNEFKEAVEQLDPTTPVQVFNASNQEPESSLDVKVLKKIGSGSQSEVFKVRLKGHTGRYVDKMKKILNNEELATTFMKRMYSEFYLGKNLLHPSLIEYKYFMRKYDENSKEHEFHIIMDLMDGGDLEQYLEDQGRPYLIDSVKEIGAQLLAGIKCLHDNDIIHQDLKPQNILFNGEFTQVKLIDLGISHRLLDSTRNTRSAEKGTPRYMSPEQVDGKLSFKIDVWAFGCVMLQFATGLMPFHKINNDMAVGLEIYRGLTPLDYIYKHADGDQLDMVEDHPQFKELLKLCFERNYSQRPSAAELMEHDFFAEYIDQYKYY